MDGAGAAAVAAGRVGGGRRQTDGGGAGGEGKREESGGCELRAGVGAGKWTSREEGSTRTLTRTNTHEHARNITTTTALPSTATVRAAKFCLFAAGSAQSRLSSQRAERQVGRRLDERLGEVGRGSVPLFPLHFGSSETGRRHPTSVSVYSR
ncbi:hypothetical protein ANO11243_022280 [Dothideomycetidae sp. 11243]|nr:hypothetical protein ANO11243_022280 [fungal sp. No.11243]